MTLSTTIISYGVDPCRARKILSRAPALLLEDMLEDDAAWFARSNARHARWRAGRPGVPDSVEAMRHILLGERRHPDGGPLYADAVRLCCEYVGERLPGSRRARGLCWSDEAELSLRKRLVATRQRLAGFDVEQLRKGDLTALCSGLKGFSYQGVGWVGVAQCEALDELFTRWRRKGRTIEEESSPEIATLSFDSEPMHGEEEESRVDDSVGEGALGESVLCLESWVLTCSERGWGLVTFCDGS